MQDKVAFAGNTTSVTGAITASFGALTFNEWLALGGFLLALGSFVINWYFQYKRYQLEKQKIK